jgi:PKHD-type hydroxylase
MIAIPDVLAGDALARVRALVEGGAWIDGNVTSGHQSALAKRNRQLPEGSAAAREAGGIILDALGRTALFVAAALPRKVFPPLFNSYEGGEAFGTHVDGAIRMLAGSDFRLRSDLSATLFLAEPDSYDGGELIVETPFGEQRAKLPMGHMLLYSSSSLHRVAPVTRGRRLASFFWIESMVRDDGARRVLLELDEGVRGATAALGGADPAVVKLTGVYHNLLRRWAES